MNIQAYITKELNMVEVFADPNFNCRGRIIPIDVVDLAKDIELNGLVQPVVVRPFTQQEIDSNPPFKYKLIAGFRRHMAHIVIKKDTILAVIRDDIQDEQKERFFNLSENLKRQDLNIIQEAKAIEKLANLGVSRQNIAKHIGMSDGWVQVRKMVLDFPEDIQRELAVGLISQPQIRELYTVFKKSGDKGYEAACDAIKKFKEAKEKGLKNITVNPNKLDRNKRRLHNATEIRKMKDHLYDTMGASMTTVALAWAAGDVSDNEFFDFIQEEMTKQGRVYNRPID